MSNLPEDLLEEILCRIPAASLERLRFTCKGWNRLFNDKRFAIKHFDKAPKQFLVLMARKFSMCLLSVSLNGDPAIAEHSVIKPSFEIFKVFHCDGLLLCTNKNNTRIVVWNPCTGQTRLIQHYFSSDDSRKGVNYTLGSYQDDNSGKNNSYKILRYNRHGELEIYETNSNSSWRILDVTPECLLIDYAVSLKGKTYWLAWDESQQNHVLASFDYTRERFERIRLPYNSCYHKKSLSVVREEKLSVILQLPDTSGKEIWVRNQIDEWIKLVTVDDPPLCSFVTFRKLVNEEKKVFMCYGICFYKDCNSLRSREIVYIAGEDIKVTHVDLEASTSGSCQPVILDYVPSLVQIH